MIGYQLGPPPEHLPVVEARQVSGVLADIWFDLLDEIPVRDYVAFFSRSASERLADNSKGCAL